MATLRLESDSDVIDLDEQFHSGRGYQSHAGAMGFGLPDADVQWFEGAGSGAIFRGRRVQSRELDLPVSILAADRAELEAYLDRLTIMLSNPCRLVRVDDEEHRWTLEVVHAGGADYSTGVDTNGETEWHATLQLHSGWPAWRREGSETRVVSPQPEPGEHPYGVALIDNVGPAEAWPVYQVQGPGSNFEVRHPDGQGFKWTGTLSAEETLTIRTEDGTVVDQSGGNRYGEMDVSPRLLPIKPGVNSLTVTMEDQAVGPGGAVLAKASETPRRVNEFTNPSLTATSGTTWVRRNQCQSPRGDFAQPADAYRWHSWSTRTHENMYLRDRATPFPEVTTVHRIWVKTVPTSGASNAYLYSGPAKHDGLATLSAYVRSKGTVREVHPVIRCTNTEDATDLAAPDRVGEAHVVPQLGEWTRISMTGLFLEGQYVRLGVRISDPLVGDWLDMTAVLIEPVPELRDYFDYDTTSPSVGPYPPGTTPEKYLAGSLGSLGGCQLAGPAPTGWSATGFAKAWVHEDSIYMLSCGDAGRLYGPTVPHTNGDPWVGSVQARSFFGGDTRLSIVPSDSDHAISRSPAAKAPNNWGTTLSATGGGSAPPSDTTAVRPMVETFGSGETRYRNLLMERSSNLGTFFDGAKTNHIDAGFFEWEGTADASRSFEFDIEWERASLTSISYQPRRWAVI